MYTPLLFFFVLDSFGFFISLFTIKDSTSINELLEIENAPIPGLDGTVKAFLGGRNFKGGLIS